MKKLTIRHRLELFYHMNKTTIGLILAGSIFLIGMFFAFIMGTTTVKADGAIAYKIRRTFDKQTHELCYTAITSTGNIAIWCGYRPDIKDAEDSLIKAIFE